MVWLVFLLILSFFLCLDAKDRSSDRHIAKARKTRGAERTGLWVAEHVGWMMERTRKGDPITLHKPWGCQTLPEPCTQEKDAHQ